MKRKIKIATLILLLAGSAILCAVRWQAWFGIPEEPQWNGPIQTYQFHTFEADTVHGFTHTDNGWTNTSTPHSLDILILGDIHNNLTTTDYNQIAQRHPEIDIITQAGDWLERGQTYYYQSLLKEWIPSELSKLPVINCPGNHEYTKGILKSLPKDWYSWFPHPQNGTVDHKGSMYYIDFPQLRFIVIDTNPLNRIVYLTRTLTWAQEAINTAGDKHVITMMHHPIFSAAEGRFNPLVYASLRYPLGQADLVISGHDHSYMRHMPFVVLNSAGKKKTPKQYRFITPEYQAEEEVYAIFSMPSHQPSILRTYRLSDGYIIDSCYVHNQRHSSFSPTPFR
ncbi:MAG: metallophosphoesterase [Paludibacteraceae bacterium]|nr:metallophosphoesterase [Paludibacteraceae bacterium]